MKLRFMQLQMTSNFTAKKGRRTYQGTKVIRDFRHLSQYGVIHTNLLR